MSRKLGENRNFDEGFESGVRAAWSECLKNFDNFIIEAVKNGVNITSYELEKFVNTLKDDIKMKATNPENGEVFIERYSDKAYLKEYDF